MTLPIWIILGGGALLVFCIGFFAGIVTLFLFDR